MLPLHLSSCVFMVTTCLRSGPAASSMNGLFEEIGPCMFAANDTGTTVIDPYSWANFANLLFLE